ncbi:LysR family transcriptional regulator [Curtobacterium sp. BRB10]|uniref:LysR family transcriptional regulator n=1 Tax=Curtobacterium sp. BRB10 TaxID=2962579 RepID=UPI0028821497|nr:LysR family transcriptional regulator [Curtobacterium sp. BRB10]MDT0235317.1 LysR family transcriptional regulator [Curtobacterium sp. BRB10]
MQLAWVETFLTVVEQGSFRAAAEVRHISQPALSKQVQALEQSLGVQLLQRGRSGTVPTPAGSALLARARSLTGAAALFQGEALRVAEGSGGLLAVGFGISSLRLLPPVIRAFRKARPSVLVTLEDLSSMLQEQELLEGRLDIGFGRRPHDQNVQYEPMWSDQLALATVDLSLDPSDVPRWIRGQSLVGLEQTRGSGLAGQIRQLEEAWQVAIRPTTTAHDLFTVLALVDAGVGSALVPLSAAPLAPVSVQLLPIAEAAAIWTSGALWRRDSLTPAAAHLREFVRASVAGS